MITLNDHEIELVRRIARGAHRSSFAYELGVRLFSEPRSNCHGAEMNIGGDPANYFCTVCMWPCDPQKH